ncbi:MAG: toprim domain-containing protein, partial [Deltaproteobacteria bacterium]|nr:toprim domain-containing protein [Deltaproteobacteria bacterium]
MITLTQRLLRMPFEAAVNVLCSGKAFGRWIAEHPQEAHCYGRVRDCMSYAARMFAMRLDLVTHYLTSRGVSEETAQRCMIGGAVGDKNVKKALYDKGFDSQTIRLSGLLNPYGKDRFQQHVVVPIFRNGQVVDFYGRIRNKEAEEQGKHRRLPADRFILGQSLFNWDPRRSDIIWVEGVFDALSLIEHGFRNAVAAYGTNGINMDLLTDSSVKKVWMCFDGDGSGRESNLKRAYDLKDAGLDVRIVDLPDGQDPNEFFLERSAADFQDLVRSATHPEVWEIEHLDAELDEHEQIMALENVMRRAGTMGPMHRAALIKRISKKLAIREKDVREQIESMSAQSANITASRGGNVTDLSTYELVHPALHFGPKGTLVTIPMMVTDQHTGRRDWEPWVMTSERESFPLTHEELNRR